jgi:cytochrome c heme-lyase
MSESSSLIIVFFTSPTKRRRNGQNQRRPLRRSRNSLAQNTQYFRYRRVVCYFVISLQNVDSEMGQASSKQASPAVAPAPVVASVARNNAEEAVSKDSAHSKSTAVAANSADAEGFKVEEPKECPWKPWWMKNKEQGKDNTAMKAACPMTGRGKKEGASSAAPSIPLSECPVMKKGEASKNNAQNPDSSACPVLHKKNGEGGGTQYNVYSQAIDPTNQMPASSVINQLPAPHQTVELSTERVKSTIPKAGSDNEGSTWTYPSPQMFYNALSRKGKLAPTEEQSQEEQSMMETVVALHNNMNETTWYKVMEWEQLLSGDKGTSGEESMKETPKLLKFCGRPSDLSPKARLKYWLFGHPLPFDRHDWTLVRPDGDEVRYVIDYYYQNEDEDGDDSNQDLNDKSLGSRHILVDVRPAVDGPLALYMRSVAMPMARRGLCPTGISSNFEPLPLLPDDELKRQVADSENVWKDIQAHGSQLNKMLSTGGPDSARVEELEEVQQQARPGIPEKEAKALSMAFAQVVKDCQNAQKAMNSACAENDDAACAQASLQLTMCVAKIMCPVQHQAVAKSVHAVTENQEEYDLRVDTALENATLCIGGVNERIAHAKMQHPELFKK